MRIGLLGGGQLGRMFIQKALDFDVEVDVLDPDAECSCRTICSNFTHGSFKSFEDVYNFGKNYDLITIEIEHVNIEALEQLEQEGKKIYPQPHVLKTIQDKGLQKEFYRANNIPSSGFFLVESKQEISRYTYHLPFMQKLRKGGYDGKGVMPLRTEADIENAFDEPSVLEGFVNISKEVSVIVARNASGETAAFPLTELVFNSEANLVDYLFSPANVSEAMEQKATAIALEVADKLQIIGVLAVEMFITKNDEVLVNEVAPRPHNSGHHTIEANITSQYEQHLRAILNLPLGNTDIIKPAVMLNLLGEKGYEGKAKIAGLEEALRLGGIKPHFYGKKITKPFRKMGHVTILDDTVEKALQKAEKVKETLKIIA